MMGDEEKPVAVRAPNGKVVRLAQPRSALADGVEHGLNVGRRMRDRAKNLAGRHLLLQRLVALPLPHAQAFLQGLYRSPCGIAAVHCPPFGAFPSMAVVAC